MTIEAKAKSVCKQGFKAKASNSKPEQIPPFPLFDPPKGMNEGMQNVLRTAINQITAGKNAEAQMTLRGLLDDVACGIYVPKDEAHKAPKKGGPPTVEVEPYLGADWGKVWPDKAPYRFGFHFKGKGYIRCDGDSLPEGHGWGLFIAPKPGKIPFTFRVEESTFIHNHATDDSGDFQVVEFLAGIERKGKDGVKVVLYEAHISNK